MVTPDANFVNMLRYSMLAIHLLPEPALSRKLLNPCKLILKLSLFLFYIGGSVSE